MIYNSDNHKIFHGDCLDFLSEVSDKTVQLVVSSPPYNIGKEYEKNVTVDTYLNSQTKILTECSRVLKDEGSLCWQVGNYIKDNIVLPLDIPIYDICNKLGLFLRNRIIWHFGHGLHCKKRFSGRYEVIMWFTKNKDYIFNLDSVRVPQKYSQKKHFKGQKKGQLSCNPLGKNPEDVWMENFKSDFWNICNVKNNHCEKVSHPCQFPIELVERLVLALSNVGDICLDPFSGSGSTVLAAIKNDRIGWGCEIDANYISETVQRINLLNAGNLPVHYSNI